jgi:crotonobetainyl-CoA:carnitine CoA-transferase CaiB-like acyl-CoA transferase
MLASIVNDVVGVFSATFMSGDWTAIAVAVISVLAAVMVMRRGTQIGSMTLLALVVFAIGCYLRGYFMHAPAGSTMVDGNRVVGQLQSSWLEFSDLQAGTLLAYFIAFMVLILVLFSLKSIFARG